MMRFFGTILGVLFLLFPYTSYAEPADIKAAERGVVRVVIVSADGDEVRPISHGTGFAITPDHILTNAHVVSRAYRDENLKIGIVPSQKDQGDFGEIVAISSRNDLALIKLNGSLRLPPLTLSASTNTENGTVTAVGYPMNVDRAQGLSVGDIFRPQPPVKSRGFLSGSRPARRFDTILHTAPIARGNSGGPLLDGCGRVLGINSFGTDSESYDAEFFFAVSVKEILPFLEANSVAPAHNDLPCRSLDDLDAQEKAKIERENQEQREALAEIDRTTREKRDRIETEARFDVQTERENTIAMAFLLMLITAGSVITVTTAWQNGRVNERVMMIAGTIGTISCIAALALWYTRPGLDALDRRIAEMLGETTDQQGGPPAILAGAEQEGSAGPLSCQLDLARSRVTSAPARELSLKWDDSGCVNDRTQYGFSSGKWSRILVPQQEDTVSVNIYDPQTQVFRTDRYHLPLNIMDQLRRERGNYAPPQCHSDGASVMLGDMQGALLAQLPNRPNERLVYTCKAQEQ